MPKPPKRRCTDGGFCNYARIKSAKRGGSWYVLWRCSKCRDEYTVVQ